MKLIIGNKNYSSWSLRPWLMLTQLGIEFEEVNLRFDSFASDSNFKREALAISPAGRVPVLVDGDLVVWDTLAIVEYVAEKFPDSHVWPQAVAARARARSICAEMHSGFSGLRSNCPMNLEASLPHIGQIVMRDHAAARADLARIVAMWGELLDQHGGPMLFGDFCAADAYFAPVCARIRGYGLPVPEPISAYVERVFALTGMRAWVAAALLEQDFVAEDEPYRSSRP